MRFEDVELTEAETQEALNAAREKKLAILEDERRKKLAEKRRADMRRPWLANELYEVARARATKIIRARTGKESLVFEPVDFQQPVLKALSLYFTNSEMFEDLDTSQYNSLGIPFSLQKGIWLWSNPGRGKTLMADMFRFNKRICYELVETPKLVHAYTQYGDDAIARYKNVITESASEYNFFQPFTGIFFNDLGVETVPAKHYGNAVNVMESIFLDAYENLVPYWHRHVTTNLTGDQLLSQYGARFVDRIKECFNIIEMRGESLRGKKWY